MLRDQRVDDRTAADQVLLDDPLELRRIALAVPRAFGIDDCNRTAFADAQAVGFTAENSALVREAQLPQPRLQKFPRREPAGEVAALRLCLIAAEKDVPPRNRN